MGAPAAAVLVVSSLLVLVPVPAVSAATGAPPDRRAPASAPITGGAFHAVVPARVFDTRDGTGGRAQPLGPGETAEVAVTDVGGVPAADVSAVVVNVTGTSTTADTHLTVWPTGQDLPPTSNVNLPSGTTVPNLVQVKVGTGGKISVRNNSGTIDVVFDLAGWFDHDSANSGAGRYQPLSPSRLLDTRDGTGGITGALGPGSTTDVTVTGVGGVPSEGVSAVVINITAVWPSASGWLAAYPSGQDWPGNSSINFTAGQVIAARAIVGVGDGGHITIRNATGSVHTIIDVAGYYTGGGDPEPTGAVFEAMAPARVLDTRDGTGGTHGAVAGQTTIHVPVTGVGGVPELSGTTVPPTAVVANVTITGPTTPTHLTIFPTGMPQPLASDLNAGPGDTRANLAILKVGVDGTIDVYNNEGAAHVIVDITGWYWGDVHLADHTVVLDAAGRAAIASVGPDTLTFTSTTAQLDALVVGDYLVSDVAPAAPAGFLRRVSSVVSDGHGGLVVTTTTATLQDVVTNGDIAASIPVDQGHVASFQPAGGAVATGGLVPGSPTSAPGRHPAAGVSGSIPISFSKSYGPLTAQAHAAVNGRLDLQVATDDRPVIPQLTKVAFSATLGEEFEASITATAEKSIDETVPLGSLVLGTFTIPVAGIPVVVTPKAELSASLNASVKGEATVAVSQSASVTATMTWSRDHGFVPSTSTTNDPPHVSGFDVKAEAEAKLRIQPNLELQFWGVLTGGIGLDPYVRLEAPSICDPIHLYAGVDLEGVFNLTVLSHEFVDERPSTSVYEAEIGTLDLDVCHWTGWIRVVYQGSLSGDGTFEHTAGDVTAHLNHLGNNSDGFEVVPTEFIGTTDHVRNADCTSYEEHVTVVDPAPGSVVVQPADGKLSIMFLAPTGDLHDSWQDVANDGGSGCHVEDLTGPWPLMAPNEVLTTTESTLDGSASLDSWMGSVPVSTTVTFRLTRQIDTDFDGIPNSTDSHPLAPDPFP